MENFRKSIGDGLRKMKGKFELVKRPHVSVKEWLETQISASASFLSVTTLEDHSSDYSTSVLSSEDTIEKFEIEEILSKPSSAFAMNTELKDIFESDAGSRMKQILEKGFDPNFVGKKSQFNDKCRTFIYILYAR